MLTELDNSRKDVLERRAEYLRSLVRGRNSGLEHGLPKKSPAARQWVLIELDALSWALDLIEKHAQQASDNGSQA